MRCCETDPSFSLNASFLAGGLEICEFEPTVKGRHMQCWVPVETGQVISVKCELGMAGFVHHVDFLVDGIIRNTWISKKNQHKADITFEEGYFRQGRSLVSGTMRVSNIDRTSSKSRKTPGSIEVRVYRADSSASSRSSTSLDPDHHDVWASFVKGSSDSRVRPTHLIEFDQVGVLTQYYKAAFRAKLRQSRPGASAWASFAFLYRSHDLLQLAGCLSSPGDQGSSNPTGAKISSPTKSSQNHQDRNSSSVEKATGDDVPDLKDVALSPKIKASGSTAPTVAKNLAVPESVPSTSKEVNVGDKDNAGSKTVVSTTNRDTSRNRNSSSESLYLQPFTPATSGLSRAPLSTGSEYAQRSRSSSLFVPPHPEERRSQQAADDSRWRTMTMHPDKLAPPKEQNSQSNGSKRVHADVDDASPEPVFSPLNDNPQAVLKRRKRDIDAKRVRVAEIQKRRDEAKHARVEAKKKAQEHQRVLQEQWASLDKQEQEMKREIEEDNMAAEAHLQECEESDEEDA